MGSHTIPLQSFKDWKSETRSKPQDGTSDSNRILDISVAHSVNPIANHAIFMRKHTNKQGIVGLSNAHARLLTPLNLPFADWTASEKQPILAGKMADLVANYQYKLEVIMQPKLFKFIGYRPPLNPLASKLRVGDMSCSPKSSGNTLNHAQTKTKSMNHLGNVALDGMHNEKRRSLHYVNNAVLPAISGRTTDTGKEASRRRSGTILGSNLDIAECHSKERVEISKKWRRSFAAMIFSARMIIISRTRLAEFEYGSNAKSLRVTAFTAIGQVEADPLLTHRVESFCARSVRDDDEISALVPVLTAKLHSFRRYSHDQRHIFCQIMQFDTFSAGRMLVKQGSISNYFYIVLSGQLEEFTMLDGKKNPKCVLSAGDSIGRANLKKESRSTCVSVVMPCELIVIDKNEFIRLVELKYGGIADPIIGISSIAKLPLFQSQYGELFLDSCMSQFSFHVYQPADVIISESEASQRIYWILSGSCKTTKTVAFISKAIDGKKFLAPFEFGPLQEGQEIVQRRLNVHELDVGIHFPPLPACNITEWDTIFSVKRSEFISALGSRKRKGRVSDRNMSLVASTKCEVASLDVMDLAIHAPIPIILSLLRSRVEIFSPQELQSIYLENLRWNDFKKSVIKGARSDARATKYQTP